MPKILDKNINDAEHYNEYWGKRNFNIDYTEPIRAEALLKKFNGGKFIDLGCGTYPYALMAAEKSKDVWALDISDKAIENLRIKFPNITYLIGNVNALPIKDNFFDYMVAGEVLEHMERPDETLKEMVRVLKPGGTMALSVPNNDMGGYAVDWHIWSFTKKELTELLKPFGDVEITRMTENKHKYGHLIGYLTKKNNSTTTKHIFYCPFTGKTPRSDNQTQEWYDRRADLFIKYVIESLKKQTNKEFIFWASFRPQEIDNPTTKKIEEALKRAGIEYLLTFRGTMMTEDRATWHNVDLEERLGKILPVLKEFIGDADYVYETNLDSDDTVHKTFSEVVIGKEFKNRGALYMKNGYVFNTDDKLAEWHNPTSNQNYTIMFPADIYFNAKERLEYLRGLKSHEEIPTLFDSEQLPDKLYCTLVHGDNISTLWNHPYKGVECDKSILKDFCL